MCEKLTPFAELGVHTTTDNQTVARQAGLIVLGVKPQMFPDVLPALAGEVAGKCVVSIAAGISAASLREALPGTMVVRAMPNTPLMVGVGATAVARADEVPADLFQAVLDLFSAAGAVAVIDEGQMDDIINVNGSSPAWFFRMADVMVRRAVEAGIDAQTALTLAAKAAPEMVQGLSQDILQTMGGGAGIPQGQVAAQQQPEAEHPYVQEAREQSRAAAEPEEGPVMV